MDRQLAQRMVGAACLLAVLVLIVPAILDGNPESGAKVTHPAMDDSLDLRTHTIRLDGEERLPPVPTAAEPQAPVLPSDAPMEPPPAPTAPPPATASPPATPDVAPKDPVVRPLAREPVARAAAPPPAAAQAREIPRAAAAPAGPGGWFVQVGSFSQQANADRLVAQLKGKGFPATIETARGGKGTLYRVRTLPVRDRAAADALAGQLARAGFAGGRVGQQ